MDLSIMQMNAPREGAGARPSKGGAEDARLRRAVHEFEALFINYMLKTMRSTIQKSELLGSGMREDIYTSLFDWELSKDMARSGGIGLGKMLLRDFQGRNRDEGAAGSKVDEARPVELGRGQLVEGTPEAVSEALAGQRRPDTGARARKP
jgi:flagellar protein FlgJ